VEGRAAAGGADAFRPIKIGRASTAIVDQIRALLLDGGLREGDRLPSERELAERFAVSRVTVRDALRALEAMGLVEIRVGARGGAFVTVPSGSVMGQTMSDMLMMQALSSEDIVEARLVVELGTVTLACTRATKEDLEQLRDLSNRAYAALSDGTYTRELSWEFHALLAQAAHNGALEGLTQSFRSSLSMHPIRTREGKSAHARTVKEHEVILDALVQRDGASARVEMAHHLLRGTGLEERESALLGLWAAGQAKRRTR
jgi:GntR family transcriptional repressor for pyruvate dehydrogenase complex